MAVVTMKNLLESGVHFGHQTKRWDPRMKRFIFAERNGIHIIDLQKTIVCIKEAYDAVRKSVLENKSVLFVGTKKQAQQAIEREAQHCGMFYVNNRWLGGMLTNFSTIKKSLLRLKKIDKMEVDGTFESLTKKEVARLNKERARLEKNLGGIKEMKELPGIIFVIDTRKEGIAVAEAQRMGIPIVAVVDTNCNPDGITYPIPGNDDAIRAINLFTSIISKAVIEADNEIGLEVIENLQEDGDVMEDGSEDVVDRDVDDEDEYVAESPSAAAVETAPVAEQVAEEVVVAEKPAEEAPAAEQAPDESESFATDDYSEYVPDDATKENPTDNLTPEEAVAAKAGIDQEKLYEEP
ncbi:MAG: 30S ribosomal protein S2 [Spirochaetaceae bacterium]|nr:MAG: 30S ribosomal protein S2 [Spirochaetaceae bacterium]